MARKPSPEITKAEVDDTAIEVAETVEVRITKFGNGHVSSGEHVPGVGDRMLCAGEMIKLDRATGEALQARGFAEIQ